MKNIFKTALILPLACCWPLLGNSACAQSDAPKGDQLDQQTLATFRSRCVVCHDDQPGDPAGDVGDLLDLTALSAAGRGYIDRAQPANSHLRTIIADGSMPKLSWKDIQGTGELTESEKAGLLQWIDRGGPSEKWQQEARQLQQAEQRTDIPEPEIVAAIARDLQTLSGAALQNARYLTLTNLHNMDSVTAARLQLYREATVKTLNSLSRSSDILGLPNAPAVNQLVPIDPASTIYRFDLRQIGWTATDWDRVAQHNPYGLSYRSGADQVVAKLTSSHLPWLRADWFCFATLQPPLYHDLVGIPAQLEQLERQLGVNRLENIRLRQVHRAGFANSKVSVNNRLLERHQFPGGYYHISYDFGRNDGTSNFFENPFGPLNSLGRRQQFSHDGGEVIYRMPNGFQGYVLVKADGARLNIAPSAIVHDNSMPGGAIINGISCISCHRDGMKPENPNTAAKLDEVRTSTLTNPRNFNAADRELIKELYPESAEFGRLLEADRKQFRHALETAGISRGADEPCRALFDQFAQNLTLEAVAGDFGLAPQDLLQRLNGDGDTRQLAERLKTAGVQRQLYLVEFRRIAELTALGEPRQFTELPLPYFGNDPEQLQAQQQTPQAAQSPRISLLDDDNLSSPIHVTVHSGDDRDRFREGEVIPCVIKARQDCFITVLAYQPDNTVEVLVPNKWHAQLRLRAGQTLRLPTPDMGFEFVSQAPHGTTEVRVIATRTPLQLAGFNPQELQQTEGFKNLGGRRAIGVQASPRPPRTDGQPLAPSDIDLSRQFAPNDWSTARWTFTTHP